MSFSHVCVMSPSAWYGLALAAYLEFWRGKSLQEEGTRVGTDTLRRACSRRTWVRENLLQVVATPSNHSLESNDHFREVCKDTK
ncbi:hypothetical protein EDD17DRAFT_477029 [Pisolithus thermaeus]|nr:hypothetical protein EDD17DRAFT_477029 [Pisolithus thermaeus]